MDGAVDQIYECKNQTCERQYQVVNGKPQRLVRTIASGVDQIIEIYEDRNGEMQLIQRKVSPFLRSEHSVSGTEGGIGGCDESCYDRTFNKFSEILTEFRQAQATPPRKLKKIDDFYVSRVGVLIHEECFDGRYDFDVEKAVTDSFVQGMACKVDLINTSEEFFNTKGAGYTSHIPRLVNLLTDNTRVDEGAIIDVGNGPQIMKNPCSDYKNLPYNIGSHMQVNKKCSYVPEIEMGMPKIICQVDQIEKAVGAIMSNTDLDSGRAEAYATGPKTQRPAYVNYKNKTKVYNYPVIGFGPGSLRLDEANFKSTIWHESLHNTGHSHIDEGNPDYAYFCEAACFGKEMGKGFTDGHIASFGDQCSLSEKNSSTNAALDTLKRALAY